MDLSLGNEQLRNMICHKSQCSSVTNIEHQFCCSCCCCCCLLLLSKDGNGNGEDVVVVVVDHRGDWKKGCQKENWK